MRGEGWRAAWRTDECGDESEGRPAGSVKLLSIFLVPEGDPARLKVVFIRVALLLAAKFDAHFDSHDRFGTKGDHRDELAQRGDTAVQQQVIVRPEGAHVANVKCSEDAVNGGGEQRAIAMKR